MTNIWLLALTVRSSVSAPEPPPVAAGGASASSCALTAADAFLCLTSSAASEPGNRSGTVMTVFPRSTVPESVGVDTSGPLIARSPFIVVVTTRPSV